MKFRLKENIAGNGSTFSIQYREKWYGPWKDYRNSSHRLRWFSTKDEALTYLSTWVSVETPEKVKYHKI